MHARGGPRGVARGQTEPHPRKENQRRTGVTASRICVCCVPTIHTEDRLSLLHTATEPRVKTSEEMGVLTRR